MMLSPDILTYVLYPFIYTDTSLSDCVRDYPSIQIIENHPRFTEKNAIIFASRHGHLDVVKHYVVVADDTYYITLCQAVQYAVYGGHLEVVKYLVRMNADVGRCDLQSLRRRGSTDMVTFLTSLVSQQQQP